MGKMLERLRDVGRMTFDCNMLTGSYEDRSQYKHVVTAYGTPRWTNGPQGWGLNFASGQRLVRSGTLTTPVSMAFISSPPNRLDQDSRIAAFDDGGLLLHVLGQAQLITVATGATARALLGTGTSHIHVINFVPCEVYSTTTKTSGAALAGIPATSTMQIGNISAGVTPTQSFVNRIMTFDTAFSQTQAQEVLLELLSERYPTKAYSFQKTAFASGSRVSADMKLDYAHVTLTNVATSESELIECSGVRLVTGSASITSNPKAIGCTATAVLYCRQPVVGGTKRTSFIWTDSVIQCGWASEKGSATVSATQNGYWWRCASGTLEITKSFGGVESVIATDGTITAGKEYDIQFAWDTTANTQKLWYREHGASTWILACEASDSDVSSTSYACMYMVGSSNKITRRITFNEIALTPDEWDTLNLEV